MRAMKQQLQKRIRKEQNQVKLVKQSSKSPPGRVKGQIKAANRKLVLIQRKYSSSLQYKIKENKDRLFDNHNIIREVEEHETKTKNSNDTNKSIQGSQSTAQKLSPMKIAEVSTVDHDGQQPKF